MEPVLYATTKSIVTQLHPDASFSLEQYKGEFNVRGRHTEVKVDVNKQIVMIYSSIPGFTVTGKDLVKKLVRFIARVNELLYFGNLEYNFETGEVRYKTSQIFQGVTSPDNSIRFLLDQHKDNFPQLANGLDEIQRISQSDAIVVANRCFSQT